MVMDMNWRRLLCKYNLRKGDLFVLSWARVRQVRRGSISSCYSCLAEVCTLFCYCLLWLDRCLETIDVCI